MTEHKLTGEEVIKALECCGSGYRGDTHQRCSSCPLNEVGIEPHACFDTMLHDLSLDLIKRQKAEIERLTILAYGSKTKTVGKFVPRDYIQLTIDDMEETTHERTRNICP